MPKLDISNNYYAETVEKSRIIEAWIQSDPQLKNMSVEDARKMLRDGLAESNPDLKNMDPEQRKAFMVNRIKLIVASRKVTVDKINQENGKNGKPLVDEKSIGLSIDGMDPKELAETLGVKENDYEAVDYSKFGDMDESLKKWAEKSSGTWHDFNTNDLKEDGKVPTDIDLAGVVSINVESFKKSNYDMEKLCFHELGHTRQTCTGTMQQLDAQSEEIDKKFKLLYNLLDSKVIPKGVKKKISNIIHDAKEIEKDADNFAFGNMHELIGEMGNESGTYDPNTVKNLESEHNKEKRSFDFSHCSSSIVLKIFDLGGKLAKGKSGPRKQGGQKAQENEQPEAPENDGPELDEPEMGAPEMEGPVLSPFTD